MKHVVINKCVNCPAANWQDEMNTFDCQIDGNLNFGDWRVFEKQINETVHDNCPLKKEPIVLELAK